MEDFICKNCNAPLKIGEDGIAECSFCNCKYKIKKGRNDEYFIEPYIDFSNFQKEEKKEERQEEKREDLPPKKNNNTGKILILLGGCVCAAVLAIVLGVNFDKRQENINAQSREVNANITENITKQDKISTTEKNSIETTAISELTDFCPKSRLFKDFVSLALDKEVSEITREDMEKFKYLAILYDKDYEEIEIKYSFGDYYANDGSYEAFMDSIYYDGNNRLNLSDLNYFTGLTELDVEYGEIQKSDISNLKNLRSYTGKETLEELTQMLNPKQMWHICLQGGADSLEGIEVYENLEELVINNSDITDISPLANIPNLYYLTLRDCNKLKDFSPLSELAGLESLAIEAEELKNIDFVKDMPFLQYLEITDTKIISIEPIRDNKNLYYLELSDNEEIEDYSVLNTLTGLETLLLDMGISKETPDLSNLISLRQLWLEQTQDTDCLANLTNLQLLVLVKTNITNPSAISNMINLEHLQIKQAYGEYEDFNFLTNLNNLIYLDISNNEFYCDISEVFQIPNLERLYMDDCIFELNTESIPEKPSLKYFSANHAKMIKNINIQSDGFVTSIDYDDVIWKEKLDFLTKLPNLEYLELSGNKLDSVAMILPLSKLQYLVIDDNYITDLSPLETLSDLYVIYCANNNITNYGKLKEKVYIVE